MTEDRDSWDLRTYPRRTSLEFRAWVGWWAEDGRFRAVPARLRDISRGGAAVLTDVGPTARGRVLFALDGLALTTGGVWARLVAARRGAGGSHLLHLAFEEDCPVPLYRAALEGLGRGGRSRAVADGANDPDPPRARR